MVALLALAGVSALAEGEPTTYKIIVPTTNNLDHDTAYVAYQIFTGSQATDKGPLGEIAYGTNFDISKFATAVAADDTLRTVITGVTASTTAKDLAEKIAALTTNDQKNALAHVINNSLKGAGLALASGSSTDLPAGYYLIVDTTELADDANDVLNASLLQLTSNITVAKKTDKPSVDKKINSGTDAKAKDAGDVTYNNKSIGDNVPYVIESSVPDMTYFTKYYMEFSDTLSKGLTYKGDLKVYIGSEDRTSAFTITTNPSPVVAGQETKISVKIDDLKAVEGINTGDKIDVVYSADVNTDAVIGVEGNPNEVKLIFSNNPEKYEEEDKETHEKKPVTGETPESKVRTYVTDVEILKVDKDDANKKLAGATFTLAGEKVNTVIVTKDVFVPSTEGTYWKLKDGTFTTVDLELESDPTIDTSLYESTETKYAKTTTTENQTKSESVTVTGTTGIDGKLIFTGLGAGTYTFTEITAPDGYNKLSAPIVIKVNWAEPTTPATSENCTWTAEKVSGIESVSVDNGTVKFTVGNGKGSTLPETGGIGTTIFYVAGSILVLAAAILLITKRRMGAND